MNTYERFRKELVRQLPSTVLYGNGYENYKNSRYVPDIVSEFGDFDVIYVMELRDIRGEFGSNPWTGLDRIDIPKFIFRTDIHNCWKMYRTYIEKNDIRAVISPYPEEYQEKKYGKHLGLSNDVSYIFLPHYIDPLIFHPYDEGKPFDVTLLGVFLRSPYLKIFHAARSYLNHIYHGQMDIITLPLKYDILRLFSMAFKDDYPLRTFVDRKLKNRRDITYFTKHHPGQLMGLNYDRVEDLITAKYLIGENFARAISASKIFISSSSRWRIPLQKTFQGMGCGVCTFVDEPIGAKDLGFEDGYNLVYVDKKNVLDKINYYLRNEEEREIIAKNGLETIRKYHTISLRVRQFINTLEEYI